MKFDKLGWVIAAALAGAMFATGFQTNTTKIGTVDIKKVFDKSDFATQQTGVLRELGQSRENVLKFINQYRSMKVEDAKRFRELSLKPNQTAQDKAAIENIRTAVVADDGKFRTLITKQNPTAEEQKQLAEYNQRVQQLGALQQQYAREFDEEVNALQGKLRDEALGRVRDSIAQIARQQGYSVVFLTDVAPYSANDITDESLKVMNTKK